MANIDRIDTPQTSGTRAHRQVKLAQAARRQEEAGGPGAQPTNGRPAADSLDLSPAAKQASDAAGVRADVVQRVKADIKADPDGYADRVLRDNIDEIVDRIAADLFTD